MPSLNDTEKTTGAGRLAAKASHKARSRAIAALVVALGAGVAASYLIYQAIERRVGEVATVPVRPVAVVKLDLPLATVLTVEMLEVIEWPASSLPAGSFESPGAAAGRVTRGPMVAGEPVVENRLVPKDGGGGGGLAAMIPQSQRAMTVRVDEASGVAGFIHPGDFVDVIATMAPEPGSNEQRARIVLQNIRVLAVGEELIARGAKPMKVPVVTLIVTPEGSERLALATHHGDLQLTLRATRDIEDVPTTGVAAEDLFGRPARAVVAMAPAPAPDPAARAVVRRTEAPPVRLGENQAPFPPRESVVEIIRGNRSEERRFRTGEAPEVIR